MAESPSIPPPTSFLEPYDQTAKHLLRELLREVGFPDVQHEITSGPHHIDVLFIPHPSPRLAELGLLGRIAAQGVALEAYHNSISPDHVRLCLHRFLSWRFRNLPTPPPQPDPQDPAPSDAPTPSDAPPPDDAPTPDPTADGDPSRLWIFAARHPREVLKSFGFRPAHGWPTGVYEAAPGLDLYLVSVPRLPPDPETLSLRLMGRGATLSAAIAELSRLPPDSPFRRTATEILYRFLSHIYKLPPRQRMEDIVSEINPYLGPFFYTREEAAAYYLKHGTEEGMKQGLQQGLQQGIEQGLQQGIEQGLQQGIEKGIEQGIEKGIEQGIEKGIEQGIEKGKLDGLRDGVLTVLAARLGKEEADGCRAPLQAIQDAGRLQDLLTLALRVDSAQAFLADLAPL